MLLREAIRTTLRSRFPAAAFEWRSPDAPIATIASPNRDLGSLIIEDDGDEATVYIGEFTHGHFNRFDLPVAERAAAIAIDVADFLEELFADRTVVWRASGSGGWDEYPAGAEPLARRGRECHLWTRPVPSGGG